jgi:hypothetical protein
MTLRTAARSPARTAARPLGSRVLTRWTGFCASCPEERPLLLLSTGPHGLRAWLSGAGPEDRTLSYTCAVCGRSEHVPATEAEDAAYDAGLGRWLDWVEEPELVATAAEPLPPAAGDDLFGLAAAWLAADPVPAPTVLAPAVPVLSAPVEERAPVVVPAPRLGAVRVVTLPAQRVSATDLVATAA